MVRLGIVATALCALSCAAVFKGQYQDVRFVSQPDGAVVEMRSGTLGRTPITAPVDRMGTLWVKMSKEGFEDAATSIDKGPDAAWLVADIMTCAIPILLCIPLAIDAVSGSLANLNEQLTVTLHPLPQAAAPELRGGDVPSGRDAP